MPPAALIDANGSMRAAAPTGLRSEISRRSLLAGHFQLSAAELLDKTLDIRPDLGVLLADVGALEPLAASAADHLNDRVGLFLELSGAATDSLSLAPSTGHSGSF